MNYYNKSAQLWKSFKENLHNVLKSLEANQLKRLTTYDDRKYVFKEVILPKVADALGLEHKSEFLRIDYAFRTKQKPHWPVPLIFIESENNWNSCYEEALKLCSTNAPLKVLITYGRNEKIKRELEDEESNDNYILNDFIKISALVGWYVILIYEELNDVIRFHVYAYDNNGKIVESEKVPFDIPVNFQ